MIYSDIHKGFALCKAFMYIHHYGAFSCLIKNRPVIMEYWII